MSEKTAICNIMNDLIAQLKLFVLSQSNRIKMATLEKKYQKIDHKFTNRKIKLKADFKNYVPEKA